MEIRKLPIKIKRLNPNAKLPTYSTEEAAGFDIYSCESTLLYPGETKAVSTGISSELPKGKVCLIWDRSGLGLKGIHRFAGVIDSDYRGEWKIVLHNSTSKPFKINIGDRIAQGVIQDYYMAEFFEVEQLNDSERGEKGFGSTGI